MSEDPVDAEAAIEACVEDFYARLLGDPELAPHFVHSVPDWPEHLRVVRDYWCAILVGGDRYFSSPASAHARMRLEEPIFARWLAHFKDAAERTLPERLRGAAIATAETEFRSMRNELRDAGS